jgi:hypothetical protein
VGKSYRSLTNYSIAMLIKSAKWSLTSTAELTTTAINFWAA